MSIAAFSGIKLVLALVIIVEASPMKTSKKPLNGAEDVI